MIETVSFMPGITVRCVQDHRFKQGRLTIQFVREMNRQEAALNALLPAVLLRGCEGASDLRDITRRLDDLYGASVGALVRRIGNCQTTGLVCGFIDDRYALAGDQILAPMLEFLGKLLLQPVLENGVFRADYVESEKKNLITTIESQLNDKRAYTMSQMLKKMCPGDALGVPRLGEAAQVAAITPGSLYAHYQKLLRESPVEIFYVGGAAPSQVEKLLRGLFGDLERTPVPLPAQSALVSAGGGEYTEQMEVAQGKLAMGFITPITLRSDRFAAMQVCNNLFGGGMTSKLFMNVREKMSLCYDIGSGYQGSKGVLTVASGIDCSKETLVRQEILKQLDAVCRQDFTAEELTAAKQSLISELEAVTDSPGAIESFYGTAAISGLGMDATQYMQKVHQVQAEDVAAAAKTLSLDTVYFLKGVQ